MNSNSNLKRPLHRICPRYLKALGLNKVEVNFKSTTNTVQVFSVFNNERECASLYESTEPLKEAENAEEVIKGIKERLEFRKQIELPFIPKIKDYEALKYPNFIKVSVLLEPLGKPITEKVKDNLELLPSWFFYLIRYLNIISTSGLDHTFITPETIYVNDNSIKFLDIDLIITGSSGFPNNHLRALRWNKKSIEYPKSFSNNNNKLSLYFLAVTFFSLLDGNKFIDQLNGNIEQKNENSKSLFDFVQKKVKPIIKNASWIKKFLLILTSPITPYANLCPSIKEIYNFLKDYEAKSYKDIKTSIRNRCVGCGKGIKEVVSLASCVNMMICENCSKEAQCKICNKNHTFECEHLLEINGKKYKPHTKEFVIGTDKKSHLSKFNILPLVIKQTHGKVRCVLTLNNGKCYVRVEESKQAVWLVPSEIMQFKEGTELSIKNKYYKISNIERDSGEFLIEEENNTVRSNAGTYKFSVEGESAYLIARPNSILKFTLITTNLLYIIILFLRVKCRIQGEESYELKYNDVLEIGDRRFKVTQADAHSNIAEVRENCKLCNNNESIILRCGHSNLCRNCVKKLPTCPICKYVLN